MVYIVVAMVKKNFTTQFVEMSDLKFITITTIL